MQLLGKRENLSQAKQPEGSTSMAHDPGTSIQPEQKSNGLAAKIHKLAATPSTISQPAEERTQKPRAFAREQQPLLHEVFDSGFEFRYRKSRIEEMSQYLAPFASLKQELQARQALNKNPLLPSTVQKPVAPGSSEHRPQKNAAPQRDRRGNLLLRAENELEYLETAYDFLEGYLREESPEDLEELSQLSGIPISEFELWLSHKVDLVNTLKDIQKKF